MYRKRFCLSIITGQIILAGIALAEKPHGVGNGGGGGKVPTDLEDLIFPYCDTKGAPYLTGDGCWQPLPAAGCPDEFPTVPGIPSPSPSDPKILVIEFDPATCAIPPECDLPGAEFAVPDLNLANLDINNTCAGCGS